MAQAVRGQKNASEQAQRTQESATQSRPQRITAAQILGHDTHDQLCDAMHSRFLNSQPEVKTRMKISTLSLQEKGGPQSISNATDV